MKIAVTGGIGSGKSKVVQLIGELGYPTFSCDEIYKEIANRGEYITRIAEVFPASIENGVLDRRKLSEIVFSDEKRRAQLNNIAHPLIMKKLFEQMEAYNDSLTFAEVPLLFEGRYENQFDFVIIVQRNLEERISAIKLRDGLSDEEIADRIKAQFDYNSLSIKNDFFKNNFFILENNSTIEELKKQLNKIIEHLKTATVKH